MKAIISASVGCGHTLWSSELCSFWDLVLSKMLAVGMYVSVLSCSPLNVCLKRGQWVHYPGVGYRAVTKSELMRYLVLAEAIFLPTCSSSVSLYPFHFLYINILVKWGAKNLHILPEGDHSLGSWSLTI